MSAKNFEFDQNRVSELVKNKLDSNELSIYGSIRSPEFYTQVIVNDIRNFRIGGRQCMPIG